MRIIYLGLEDEEQKGIERDHRKVDGSRTLIPSASGPFVSLRLGTSDGDA